jgi:acetyl esterase/lipase
VVQEVSSAASHPALRDAILPRTAEGSSLGNNPRGFHRCDHLEPELLIAIKDQVFARRFKWKCLAQLLDDPSARRMLRDVEVQDASTIVADDEEAVGRPWVSVGHVSRPTMTVYSPTGKNTGAAVVFPGGGYQILARDLEGTEVCDWLTSKGITCVLLKYRVPGEEFYPKSAPYPKSGPYPESPMALEDAQRTVGLVRFRAAEWHIDPHKIGVLGFSAGGHLVAAMSTHFAKRLYPPMDAADKESCRPDFAVAIYPGHLSLSAAEWDTNQGPREFVVRHSATADKHLALNPDIPVTSQTPPTFLLQAEDDHVDDVSDSLAYYIALKNAGVPVEMHLYAQGGHAFGLRRTKFPITGWPQLVETWLGTIGMISD